ncbi:MAG: hypothetical protein IJ466_08065 [Clostridia bacterium]|nr:hypothetical protein [Clostridia bacterium]
MLNSLIGDWVRGLPAALQYLVVIAIVLIILYACLALTRLIGKNRGSEVHYDNPEEYEKQVPDLFASTMFRRKPKQDKEEKKED